MRVRARSALRPYYNYRLVDIAAGEEVSGGLALHLLETGSDVEPADDAAAAWSPDDAKAALEEDKGESGKQSDDDLDIDGNADDVLAWVGDNPDRAAEAIEQEAAKDKPRSTLLKKLQKIVDADSGE